MKTDLPRPHFHRSMRVSLTASVVALCGLVMAGDAAAQRGDVRLDRVQRRVQSLSPISGPPGTKVTLSAQSLPAITPMRIGMGTTRFGFEEVGQVMTNERGELSLEVRVPGWARHDRNNVFIVFDFYFAPLAFSDIFHVTGPAGTVVREGRVTDEGAECLTMRGEYDELYALVGQTTGLSAGEEVRLEASVAESSICAEGTTLNVVRVIASGRPPR